MSALAGEFVVHQGAADKFDWQDDWRKREQRWWESGGWGEPSAKQFYRLARGRRLPERTEKALFLGRPPERREVNKRRAQRLLDLSWNQGIAICEDVGWTQTVKQSYLCARKFRDVRERSRDREEMLCIGRLRTSYIS